jgi:hypothetical protein
MRKSFIVGLVLMAGVWSADAGAQTADDGASDVGAASMPSIILPEQLTSPITGDFRAQSGDADAGQPPAGEEEAPYSVEGEETLDPETN